MSARTFELERLRAQLQLWSSEMIHLQDKVDRLERDKRNALENEAHDTLQAMLAQDLERLQKLWAEAEQALHDVEQARDDEWQIVWEHAERILDRLGAAFEQSRTRFGE
jgi:prefoldin subunit 5